jgi:hypothetical protein
VGIFVAGKLEILWKSGYEKDDVSTQVLAYNLAL